MRKTTQSIFLNSVNSNVSDTSLEANNYQTDNMYYNNNFLRENTVVNLRITMYSYFSRRFKDELSINIFFVNDIADMEEYSERFREDGINIVYIITHIQDFESCKEVNELDAKMSTNDSINICKNRIYVDNEERIFIKPITFDSHMISKINGQLKSYRIIDYADDIHNKVLDMVCS